MMDDVMPAPAAAVSTPPRRPSLRERLVLDEDRGEYRDGAIRYLVMRPDVLMGIFAALPVEARHAALDALAASASTFGGRSVQAYRDAGAQDPTELLRVMTETSSQLGWGRWSFDSDTGDSRDRTLRLTVCNSPFAAGYGASETPVCHAIRGIFTALAPAVFDRPVEVRETACASQGDGDVCHFVMRPI